jgi:PAS domain S-box-containing protein
MLISGSDLSVASAGLGPNGGIGGIVAGSWMATFPAATERLAFDVATNQATTVLQQARLLREHRRVAADLDERVAQRARELDAANQELKKEIAERRRTEDALRANQLSFQLTVDSIPGMVHTMTATGRVELVNHQILEYFGKTLEELNDWGVLVHPDDRSRVIDRWTHSVATGEPYDAEHRVLRADGTYGWLHSRGLPLRDISGNIVRWYNLLTDIDERKRAEEALSTNERNLKLIIDTIPAMAWSARPDGSAEFVNEHYIDFTGLSAEQASGWGWTRAVHPGDLDDLTATWQRILASEAAGEAEARLRRHDGAYRWFLFRANPLRDESGAIVKWYGVSTDIEDRKRAEQEGRRSEARKTAILDSALDCIVTIDHEGCITEFNPAAERTFGYRRDEVVGRQLAEVIVPPALRERHRQGLARYLTTGESRVLGRRIEMAAMRADGSEFPAELAITRIPLDGPPSFTGYLRDITERKRAEEELRRSEAFLTQAQRLTLTGSLWWKVSTGEITWSAESYRLMGYPTTVKPTVELILSRVHPEDLALVREMVERSAREGSNIDFEHRLLMPDGSVKHVHVVMQNVSGDGRPPEFAGAVSDVTERKRVEAELRRAYDSFADAQRLSHTGSFITDLVGDDHNWSEETYRIFEFEPGTKVTVRRVREIIHPDDQPSFESMISRAMSGVDVTFSFRIVTARGAVKYVRGVAHVIEQIEGRPMFVGALQDVTESMVAEEALNRARSELAHVARVTTLSTLTASIAHEVNQPLSGIITNASTCLRMLAADPPDIEGARETARRTVRDGNRASDVVTRLRALFSKKEFTLESLDLNDASREVIALSLSDLQRHRVVLQAALADDLPLITGDRIQLQQVILNLLRNASDAMVDVHERPRLLLIKTEREDGNRVRLSVRDAGIGLPPQSLDSLFDAFYTTKSGGMGIGLFVSRSIVERHQGRLWAEPNDGPGATFSFSMPVQTA